jgi:hypothetical protein
MTKIQGEGDYISGRKFQEAQHRFAEEGAVEEAGREAADALDGPEAEQLEKARQDAAKGHATKSVSKRSFAHQDRKLDESLDQTFPASDPSPTSPGSN